MLPVRFLFSCLVSIIFINSDSVAVIENPTAYAEDTLEQSHGKLIYSSVLFRHGDRTPVKIYPKDPYTASVWPEGVEQLTKEGKNQEYILGKWFRARYETKLNLTSYQYNLVLVNSSDYDRTLMSAELVLAGLFPPSSREKFTTDDLNWQPIAVHTKPKKLDMVLDESADCERYVYEQENLINVPAIRQGLYESKLDLLKYIDENSGFPLFESNIVDTYKYLGYLYDDLSIEEKHNFTLPTWTEKIYPNFLTWMVPISFELTTHTFEMKRLRGGPILGCIVADMLKKQQDETWNQVLHLYSSHDTTMVPLLNTLGIYNFIQPPLGSAVIIELRLKNDEYVVTIIYHNSTTEPPYFMQVPGCEEICKWDTFFKIASQYIPENWYEECQIGFFEKLTHFVSSIIFVILIILLILAAVVIALIFIFRPYYRRHRYKQYETIETVNNR